MKKFITANLTAALLLSMSTSALAADDAENKHTIGKFSWSAQAEIKATHNHARYSVTKRRNDIDKGYRIYFVPEYALDSHWTAISELELFGDEKKMSGALNGLWLEGDYDTIGYGLGAMPLYTNENGLIFDTGMIGGEAIFYFGDSYVAVGGGQLDDEDVGSGVVGHFFSNNHDSTVIGLNAQYDHEDEPGLYGGVGFYYIKDKDFRTPFYKSGGDTDKANIVSANAGYRVDDKLDVYTSFASNTKADYEKNSWQAQVSYGNYDDYPDRGDWSVWAGYRRLGTNVSFQPSTDDTMRGTRGWNLGASYAPMKNLGVTARYFNGKFITGEAHARKVFGQVEFFF